MSHCLKFEKTFAGYDGGDVYELKMQKLEIENIQMEMEREIK